MIWKIQIGSFYVARFCISWYKRFGQIPKENEGNLVSFLGFGIISGTEQSSGRRVSFPRTGYLAR